MDIYNDSKNLKIVVKNNNKYVFDQIRKKYVLLTPEEWVRQNTLMYLVYEKNYPVSLIRVEQKLEGKDQYFRSDIIVYNKNGKALMIVECKAEKVKITQAAFDQISKYNIQFEVDYLMVTNGVQNYICKMDFKNRSYSFLNEVPDYTELK